MSEASSTEACCGRHEERRFADGRGQPLGVLSRDPARLVRLHGEYTVGYVGELLWVHILCLVRISKNDHFIDSAELTKNLAHDRIDHVSG